MMISLKSIDPKRNRFRYYIINDLQPDLFSDYSLEIHWGREDCKGKKKTFIFSKEIELEKELSKRIKKRIRNGYKQE